MGGDGMRRWGWVLLFAVLAGLVGTFAHGYYFGRINQACHLPLLLREMDSGFLVNDFFVDNTSAGFGPRFFYLKTLALLGRILPLPLLFFLLTWLQNAALALVTFLVARRLFGREHENPDLPAAVAATLVMAVNSVELGAAAFLVHPAVTPQTAVTGLALWSLWQGLRCRPLAAAALAVPVILLHPLVGVLTGLLGLSVVGLSALFGVGVEAGRDRVRLGATAFLLAAGLAGAAGAFWLSVGGERLMDAREYVELYARFRNPHHIVPGFFPVQNWVAMVLFMVAGGISWHWWYRRPGTDRAVAVRILFLVGLVWLLCLVSWLYVEFWPSRFWATLQPFRLVFVIKWLGLLLFAGTIARYAASGAPGRPVVAALLFFPFGFGQPYGALWAHGAEFLRRRLSWAGSWLFPALGFLLSAGIIAVANGARPPWAGNPNNELFALIALGTLAACWLVLRPGRRRALASLAAAGLAVGLVVANKYLPAGPLAGFLRGTVPIFTATEVNDNQDRIMEYCRNHTPTDAVFIIPPWFERFSVSARRAVVVKFKCTVVSDRGLLEWRERLTDCYGEVAGRGFDAVAEMDRNHRAVTDEDLVFIARKYGAGFAVLHRRTRTGFPVLFEEDRYKVVRIVPEAMTEAYEMLVFRAAPGAVEHPSAYFAWLLAERLPRAVPGLTYSVPVENPVSVEQALAEYRAGVLAHGLPDLGEMVDGWQGPGPDGVTVTVLLFRPGFPEEEEETDDR